MCKLSYILILCAVLVIAIGQIIFKYAASHLQVTPSQTWSDLLRDNVHPLAMVTLALVLYLLSTIAWVISLRSVPLSVAFMFNSLAFVLVPAAGFVFFGETIPRFFLPGLALIMCGIFVITGL